MKYELWHSRDDGSDVYTLLPVDLAHDRSLLEPEARMIWSVEAATWEDACRRQHEFLGWEPYKPMPDS